MFLLADEGKCALAQIRVHDPERKHRNPQSGSNHGLDGLGIIEGHDDGGLEVDLAKIAVDQSLYARAFLEQDERELLQVSNTAAPRDLPQVGDEHALDVPRRLYR